jgi:hypothetical protein
MSDADHNAEDAAYQRPFVKLMTRASPAAALAVHICTLPLPLASPLPPSIARTPFEGIDSDLYGPSVPDRPPPSPVGRTHSAAVREDLVALYTRLICLNIPPASDIFALRPLSNVTEAKRRELCAPCPK